MVNPLDSPVPDQSLIALLDETELMVAAAIAMCDGQLPESELAGLMEQSAERVASALAVLRDLGLVEDRPDGVVVVRHALVGASVQAACRPEDRRRLHAAVASAFDRNAADAAFVLDHIEASGAPDLALKGLQLCLYRCRSCLLVGEVSDALTFLNRGERLIRLMQT